MHWLAHWLGLDNVSGPVYAWWSGAGSIIVQPGILIGGLAVWRHHMCHARWCVRFHRFETAAGDKVCRRHHPDRPNRAPHARDIHRWHGEAK